jgi:RNA polymerase sigma factor (sigma-70 family)
LTVEQVPFDTTTNIIEQGPLLHSGRQNKQQRMTEHEVIRGVIARDREAVACLVETYRKKVIKTAYYFLGNMEDAEDVAQEVFLEIVNSIGRFRMSSALSTWIYRITVNRSLNAVKRNKQRQIFVRIEKFFGIAKEDESKAIQEVATDDNPFDYEEAGKIVKEAVADLPGNQRTVFILCKYEEMSYKEIAEVTGMSVSSVESLLHRAKMNLQKKLAGYYSEYSKKSAL